MQDFEKKVKDTGNEIARISTTAAPLVQTIDARQYWPELIHEINQRQPERYVWITLLEPTVTAGVKSVPVAIDDPAKPLASGVAATRLPPRRSPGPNRAPDPPNPPSTGIHIKGLYLANDRQDSVVTDFVKNLAKSTKFFKLDLERHSNDIVPLRTPQDDKTWAFPFELHAPPGQSAAGAITPSARVRHFFPPPFMDWIRNNNFLAAFLAVMVLGIGGLTYLLIDSMGRYDQVAQDYDTQVKELKRLQALKPFPDQANLASYQEVKKTYKQAVDELQAKLAASSRAPETPPRDPTQFQDRLRRVVDDVTKAAQLANVAYPDDFYLGFERYRNSLPDAVATPLLSRQLDNIQELVGILIKERVDRITAVKRVMLPQESGGGAAPVFTPAQSQNNKPGANAAGAAELVTKLPVVLEFTGPLRFAPEYAERHHAFKKAVCRARHPGQKRIRQRPRPRPGSHPGGWGRCGCGGRSQRDHDRRRQPKRNTGPPLRGRPGKAQRRRARGVGKSFALRFPAGLPRPRLPTSPFPLAMNWIKQNYDRFLLALLAAGLVVSAFLLFNNARNFNSVFESLKEVPPPDTTPLKVDLAALSVERQKLAEPFTWNPRQVGDVQLPAFVSVPYIEQAEPDGRGGFTYKLVDPYLGDMVHPPIPNKWLIENKQDMLSANVMTQDTDNDGFNTLDEFLGKTDPNNKDSHPPYYTKLFLKNLVRIPFRLLFAARNGNIALINAIDLDLPTQFLKEGDAVKGTRYKMIKLTIQNAKVDGLNRDTSEVTLENLDTHEKIVLPKDQEIDSPTSYAVLTYIWNGGDVTAKPDFAVKKNQEFSIKPDVNVKYKCLSLSDSSVTVLKEDENKTIEITAQVKK